MKKARKLKQQIKEEDCAHFAHSQASEDECEILEMAEEQVRCYSESELFEPVTPRFPEGKFFSAGNGKIQLTDTSDEEDQD